jgi:hypothetical protein
MTDGKLRQYHDMGGLLEKGPVKPSEHDFALWEKRIEAMLRLLMFRDEPVMTVDELRRGIEELDPKDYDALSYYERWIKSLTNILVEKGVLDRHEIYKRMEEIKVRQDDLP